MFTAATAIHDFSEFYNGVFNTYDSDSNGYWEQSDWDDAGDAGWFDI